MKLLWKCTWDNGYVSFVLGRSKREAIRVLRAELEADIPDEALEPVDHRATFFVTFTPCYERHEHDLPEHEVFPHWHASDGLSSLGVDRALGDPPPLPPPPKSLPPAEPVDPDDPLCAKCGHARFASVHHPAYDKPNKCDFEAPPAQVEQRAYGPESPTSE